MHSPASAPIPASREYRVLAVDDDPASRTFVSVALGLAGMEVDEAPDGPEARELFARHAYDAVVLDVKLPSVSGVTLLRELRARRDVAVVMLSACDDPAVPVIALEAGADDYCTKPLCERELVIRLTMALARHEGGSTSWGSGVIDAGAGLTIEPRTRRVFLGGHEVDLTAKEFELLVTLAEEPGQVFTRVDLLEQVWQAEPDWQSVDTVTEHVYRLRQKLEHDGERRHWIQTVRGAGYRFVPLVGSVDALDELAS